MTTRDSTWDDARSAEHERAVEALTEALEAEELAEKDYHIREALQLVNLNDE